MSNAKFSATLPDGYEGRGPAFIKHTLLKLYLEALFLIVGMGADKVRVTELCYVDCFAGPWGDDTEDLGTTSIAISLGILDQCRKKLSDMGKTIRFRALYVEKDKKAFARLEKYLRDHTPVGIDATPINGDFVDLQPQILEWCGSNSFAFFFIDPKGWSDVGVGVLRPLLERPKSEFLITFMYDFLNRAASMQDMSAQIGQLLGEAPSVAGLSPPVREKKLLQIYRKNLKAHVQTSPKWPARSAYVAVQDGEKDRTKYHLVYLTSHPLGIIRFMEISEGVALVQRQVRATTKQDKRVAKSGQNELFQAEEFVNDDDGRASPEEVERFWMKGLSRTVRQYGQKEFADWLEETDWFPCDLQQALGRLIADGKVVNLDAKGKRKSKFLHLDKNGERLQLTGD